MKNPLLARTSRRAVRLAALACLVHGAPALAADNPPGNVFDPFFRFTETEHKPLAEGLNGDTVDPFTGTLSVVHEDLVLPGVAGHDLRVVRAYSSKIWSRADLLTAGTGVLFAEAERSVLGYGWTFHFGRLRSPNAMGASGYCSGDFPVFEAPDGSSRVFYPSNTEAGVFVSKDHWRLEKNCATLGGLGTCVWSSTGLRHEFETTDWGFTGTEPVASVSRIVDPFGNAITFTYGLRCSTGLPTIESVTDTYGRQVTFEYHPCDVDGARLRRMRYGESSEKVLEYVYTQYSGNAAPSGGYNISPRRFLTSVTKPAGPPIDYAYATSVPVTANQYALKSISYPSGAKVDYTYKKQDFFAGMVSVPFPVVATRTVSGRSLAAGGVWTYSYSAPGVADPSQPGTPPLNVTEILRPDGKKDVYSYVGFGYALAKTLTEPGASWTYLVGAPKVISLGNGEQVEELGYGSGERISDEFQAPPAYSDCAAIPYPQLIAPGIYPMQLLWRVVSRDYGTDAATGVGRLTAQFLTEYEDHDAYGQARLVRETGGNAQSLLTERNEQGTWRKKVVELAYAGTKTRTTTTTYFSVEEGGVPERTVHIVRGRPLTETMAEDGETVTKSWTYDGPSFARDSETVGGVTTRFEHHTSNAEGAGNLSAVVNARQQRLTLTGYAEAGGFGLPTRLDFNGAFTEQRTQTWEGWLATRTDGRGYQTTFEYDALGRLKTLTPPAPNVATSYAWATDNSTLTMTRGAYSLVSTMDGLGRPISTLDSDGTRTTSSYDNLGQKRFASYPHTTTELGDRLDYDAIGRVTKTTRAQPRDGFAPCAGSTKCATKIKYDSNCIETTVERDALTSPATLRCGVSFGDPAESRLAAVADAVGGIWQYDYTASSGLRTVFAPLAQGDRRSTYLPNTAFLATETTGESGTTTYEPNELLQVWKATDARGVVTEYGYEDPLSRLRTVTYSASGYDGKEDLTIGYDLGGNLTDLASANGGAIHLVFDELKRVTTREWTYPGFPKFTTTLHYDPAGCLDEVTYPTGPKLAMTCDASNRVKTMKLDGVDVVTDVTYHPGGMVSTVVYGDAQGTTTTTTYDDLLRAKTITTSPTGIVGLSYGYDGADNIVSYGDSAVAGSGRTMTYDAADRLQVVLGPQATAPHQGTLVYDFDVLGNRKFKSGELSTTYRYGEATNRLEWTEGPERLPSLRLRWDVAGRLAWTSDGASYRYDGAGRRVAKEEGERTTLYHHDPAGRVVAESQGADTKEFVYLGNKLVAARTCTAGATPGCRLSWYHTDALGSVVARTDETGAVEAREDYQPFGEQGRVAGAVDDRQYNGRVYDAGTGFHDYGARLYWPEIGRFISADSVMGSPGSPMTLNRYSYVLNNPYKYTDPTGNEVALQWHNVAGGNYHTSIRVTPENQAAYKGNPNFKEVNGKLTATLGAGAGFNAFSGPVEALKKGVNRPADFAPHPDSSRTIDTPSAYKSEDAFISALFDLAGGYKDNAKYPLVPYNLGPDEYNSNSYTSGILQSAGAKVAGPPANAPGWEKPLPKGYFGIDDKAWVPAPQR